MTPTIPPLCDSFRGSQAPAASSEAYVVWRDFKPRGGGVLDFVDDMLERLIGLRLRIDWCPGIVMEFPASGGEPQSYDFKFRGYRGVIARLSKLCNDESEVWINPYGGTGSFTDPRWPHVCFHVDFMNTPAEQRLELTPVFASETS